MGSLLEATGVLSTVFGLSNQTNGYASFMQGYNNTESTLTGFAMTVGHSNVQTINAGLMGGAVLDSNQGVGTFICGAANSPVAGANNGSEPTQPMIIVGNGTHTTPSNAPWVATKRSNLLEGLRDGTFRLPETTIATIDAEITGRQVVTREWIEAQGFLTSNLSGQLVTSESGLGLSLSGRDENKYGDVGNSSVDLSFSSIISSTRGATGDFAFASGRSTTASGDYSVAMGDFSISSGLLAFAINNNTVASGIASAAFNSFTEASGTDSFAINSSGNATGRGSFVANLNNTSPSFGETTMGAYATEYIANSATSIDVLDRVFTIGNGIGSSTRSDAFTVLKSGRIGVGFNNFETNLNLERFSVNGSVRASSLVLDGLPTYADDASAGAGGLSTDSVYKTVTGELRIKL